MDVLVVNNASAGGDDDDDDAAAAEALLVLVVGVVVLVPVVLLLLLLLLFALVLLLLLLLLLLSRSGMMLADWLLWLPVVNDSFDRFSALAPTDGHSDYMLDTSIQFQCKAELRRKARTIGYSGVPGGALTKAVRRSCLAFVSFRLGLVTTTVSFLFPLAPFLRLGPFPVFGATQRNTTR